MTMLDHVRTEIEAIDTQLLELIAKRLGLAVKVGRHKEKMSIPNTGLECQNYGE